MLGTGAVRHVDDCDTVRRRRRRVHLRDDPAAGARDVRGAARPGHVRVARLGTPAGIQPGVADEGEAAVVSLLGAPRLLVRLGDVALDPLLGEIVLAAEVVVSEHDLGVERVGVPLRAGIGGGHDGRAQGRDHGNGHEPASRRHVARYTADQGGDFTRPVGQAG